MRYLGHGVEDITLNWDLLVWPNSPTAGVAQHLSLSEIHSQSSRIKQERQRREGRSGTINHHLKWQPRKKRLMNTQQCFTPSQYPALLLPQQKKLLHKHLLSQANRHISEFIARALHPKFKTSNKKKGSTWISSTPYWKYNRFLGGSPMLAATYNALCDLGPYYLRNCFCLCEILLQLRPTGMLSCGFMV